MNITLSWPLPVCKLEFIPQRSRSHAPDSRESFTMSFIFAMVGSAMIRPFLCLPLLDVVAEVEDIPLQDRPVYGGTGGLKIRKSK